MSFVSKNPLLLAYAQQEAAGGISRSLRFNSSDSAYLSRTPAVAGNRTTFTWAGWVKRSTISDSVPVHIFSAGTSGASNVDFFGIETDNTIRFGSYNGSAFVFHYITTQVFRDPSAWYHLVLAVDTTIASPSSDRVKFYVNGVRVTTFSTATDPGPSAQCAHFNTTSTHYLGKFIDIARYFPGYLADIHFIDGQALTPSSFTEVSATTGQLVPKAYTGSFGTNGFWLPFSDNSAATATTLGKDYSGNGNNWTPNNLQTTTGGPTSVAAASGALPIYNTTDTYGATKGTGTRTDSNSSSIVLALPMDGANNGTTFTDESATIKGSGSAKTVTANGNAKTVTSQSKYYGSSGAFDGGDDYLLASASADFQFGSGNFTIETWFYPNTADRMALYHGSFGTDWSIGIDFSNITQTIAIWASSTGTNWNLADGDSAGNRGSTVLVTGRWHHVAMVRNGATLQLYVNGILDKQFTGISGSIVDRSSSQPSIGTWFGGQYDLNGYLQDFRIYKGVAKYTGNFNPPSSTQNATVAAGNDSLVDTPTSYGPDTGAGGEVRGNYCTFNPLSTGGSTQTSTLSNGNLDFTSTSGSGTYANRYSTFAVSSGKWYAEFTLTASTNSPFVGVTTNPDTKSSFIAEDSDGWAYFKNGTKWNSNSSTAYGASWTVNDVIGVALDIDSGTLVFYKNGVSQGTAYSGLPAGNYFFGVSGTPGEAFTANFGQRPFAYTAPSGFKALCDTNLPAPVVAKPNTVMDTVLWTGNDTGQTITLPGAFSPDLVWTKMRSAANAHWLFDVIRGANQGLSSSSTTNELTRTNSVTAFDSTGFTLGTSADVNSSAYTYVAWCWDAGSSTVTNTQGSITSSCRTNQSSGFSIVSYTGNGGSNVSVGHGLGIAPVLLIVKSRSTANDWDVTYTFGDGSYDFMSLNTTAAKLDIAGRSAPTSTLFYVNGGLSNVNGTTYVAYAWAPVAGYSSFGSYTGNGSSTDGPFVYTGFRPRWIMVKCTQDIAGDVEQWVIKDTARSSYNEAFDNLYANLSNAEDDASGSAIDILSNGFKPRGSYGGINGSATYIYAAFAESPLNYSRAR